MWAANGEFTDRDIDEAKLSVFSQVKLILLVGVCSQRRFVCVCLLSLVSHAKKLKQILFANTRCIQEHYDTFIVWSCEKQRTYTIISLSLLWYWCMAALSDVLVIVSVLTWRVNRDLPQMVHLWQEWNSSNERWILGWQNNVDHSVDAVIRVQAVYSSI